MTTNTLDALGVPLSHHDLLTRPLVATLSTIGSDHLVQSTAVWYLIDQGELVVSVRKDRQKYRNLRSNPTATLLVIDPNNVVRTLEIRADVELRDDPDKAQSERFAPMYGHAPSAWDPAGAERAVVVLRPRKVVVLG
jgi:PPOX class probable F420-dependent enzyme